MEDTAINLGYNGDTCPNCGLVRVERYSDGKRICEKCNWCIEDEAYYVTQPSNSSAVVIISGDGADIHEQIRRLAEMRERAIAEEKERLAPYKDRADKLGIDIQIAASHATAIGMTVGEWLQRMECLKQSLEPSEFIPEPNEGPYLTDAQIRKQLKYEKNPMRVKQLNKMLSGRKGR